MSDASIPGISIWSAYAFDIANWMSTSINKNQLLWLVAAKSVDAHDHCIWHPDNIPTTPNNFLSCFERRKFEANLQVSTGTKQNGAFCYGVLAVSRSILLIHLTVLSDLEAQVFFVPKNHHVW